MLGPRAEPAKDTGATNRAGSGPVRAITLWDGSLDIPGLAKWGCVGKEPLAAAVEAELDHPGGHQAGALAARVAGDAKLGGERVEAALGGALAHA
jgi:hypothetical protein